MSEEDAIDPDPEIAASPVFPDPDVRMKQGAKGIPVTLADGRIWLLADIGLAREFDEIRDRIFDQSTHTGAVDMVDIRYLAIAYLGANYDLEFREMVDLIVKPDDTEFDNSLASAVCINTFGPKDIPETYTNWVLTQFYANGIDPADVPVMFRPVVLAILVKSGRAIPQGQFIGSIRDAAQWAEAEGGSKAQSIRGAR